MADCEGEQARLRRELEEVRLREQQYRERLWHSENLAARLRVHAQAIHEVFRNHPPTHAALERTLVEVARISSQALEAHRTSVWVFDRDHTRLRCVIQLEGGAENTPAGLEIECAACPRYVHALSADFAVAVSDALADARTRELDGYLRANNVGALLDIPILVPEGSLGVVCHEHVGGPRVWHEREVDFAAAVGQQVALTLEAEQRMLAEMAVRDSEARYQDLVESLPVTVYSFDAPTGELQYLSPRATDLSGRDADYWRARGAGEWIRQIHPEDRAPVLDRFARGGQGGFADEVTYRLRQPDGSTRWIRDTCRVVRDAGGAARAIQGVLVDVTASVEAEHSRMEFERRYRSLLENVDLLAVSLDTRGNITFANQAFLRTVGRAEPEVVGKDYFDLTTPEADRDEVRQRYLASIGNDQVDPRFELDLLTRAGDVRRLLCTSTVLRGSDDEVVGASTLALDITDRRRLETELLAHTKFESLGRLAAGVAHDFNNLLTVLLGQVDLMRVRSTDAALGPQLDSMERVLGQACELTTALRMYGRRESTAGAERASLDALIEESKSLLEAIASKDLRLDLALDTPGVRLRMDTARMRQVLMNLVGNAADATRGHGTGIRISTHVEFLDDAEAVAHGTAQGGEFLVLTVADDGVGMDAATLRSVFEPFFTTKADGRGTGLGLAIIQSVVSQMRGFARVQSEPEEGTAFRLYFPVTATPSRAARARPSERPRRVLLVEPQLSERASMAGPLGAAGYEVRSVPDTRSAAEMLADDSVDLLITDQNLPDGSGSVLARSARSVRPGLRAVLVADAPSDDDAFDSVLVRPYDDASVLRAAMVALESPAE